MIQRLQSIYLVFTLLFTSILFYGSTYALEGNFFLDYYGFVLPPVLTLVTLFLFKKRIIQAFLCIILILLQMIQIAIYFNQFDFNSRLGWTEGVLIFSLINIILIFLARRAILKDEALVRSIDRIR